MESVYNSKGEKEMTILSVTTQQNGYKETIQLDEFYKSLMFQSIMDGDHPRNERDTMLVVFRKTIHFNKWSDHISMYWLSKAIGISENTLRETIKRLELKGFLTITKSKGGRTSSTKKFHSFSLSDEFLFMIFDKWYAIKEENGFTPKVIFC